MLERLIIRNIALIEHLDFELGAGLNVLTGETGAGKSIIVDSVNLILGERANRELISSGSQKARVEAFFNINGQDGVKKQLDALGIEYEDDTLVVMREITASGKSTCRLNGEIVPLATLKTVTDTLVDVHGQHEHQSLLSQKKHIGMLDNYAGLPVAELKEKTENLYRQHSEVVHKLNSGFLSEAERERRIDILSYQINEIDAAALTVGEEATIQEELNMLSNAEKINSALENSGENISGDGGALEKLGSAVNSLAQIAEISSKYGELYELLNNTYYELEDGAYQLRELRLGYEYSPERLDELETRLDLINSLKRKYGRTIEDILKYRSEASAELDELTGSQELRDKLTAERNRLAADYCKTAATLTEKRKEAAEDLCRRITEQLQELGMAKAAFGIVFLPEDGKLHANGNDDVEFMLSANKGEPLKPLSKVASGGELSRVMLAIKTVCAGADGTPTLIFDEVDTGISGRTAVIVGERLYSVARSRQVLSITHLPQIAAFADCHLFVEKHSDSEKTKTSLRELNNEERSAELARIMGASAADESAQKYASELIESANRFKLSKVNELD